MSEEFKPNWAIHPGASIIDAVRDRAATGESPRAILDRAIASLSTDELCAALRITAPVAHALELFLGSSEIFWLQLQANYDADCERLRICPAIAERQAAKDIGLQRRGLGPLVVRPLPRQRRSMPDLAEACSRLTLPQFFRLPQDARDCFYAHQSGRRLARAPKISELRAAYIEMVNRSREYDVGDDVWHWEIAMHCALWRIVGPA